MLAAGVLCFGLFHATPVTAQSKTESSPAEGKDSEALDAAAKELRKRDKQSKAVQKRSPAEAAGEAASEARRATTPQGGAADAKR